MKTLEDAGLIVLLAVAICVSTALAGTYLHRSGWYPPEPATCIQWETIRLQPHLPPYCSGIAPVEESPGSRPWQVLLA